MNKLNKYKLLVSLIIILLMLITSIFYNRNRQLIQQNNELLKKEIVQIKSFSNLNIDLLSKIISSKNMKYKELEKLMFNHEFIRISFSNIVNSIKLGKSEEYFEEYISTDSEVRSILEIEDFYRMFRKDFDIGRENLSLNENTIKNLNIFLDTYNFYVNTSTQMIEQIDKKNSSWSKGLIKIYRLNMWSLSD